VFWNTLMQICQRSLIIFISNWNFWNLNFGLKHARKYPLCGMNVGHDTRTKTVLQTWMTQKFDNLVNGNEPVITKSGKSIFCLSGKTVISEYQPFYLKITSAIFDNKMQKTSNHLMVLRLPIINQCNAQCQFSWIYFPFAISSNSRFWLQCCSFETLRL